MYINNKLWKADGNTKKMWLVFTRRLLGQNAPLCSMAYLAKHAHLSVKLYASFILTIMEQETDYKDLLGVI